jgi:ATP-dependent Clp protease ATP-binding subunit ClpA
MTSNAGSHVAENALGFNRDKNQSSKDKSMKALREFLRPEFLGRVDEIVVFNTLGKEDLVKIAAILIDEFREPLKDKGIALSVGEGVYELVAEKSEDGGRGARDIRRTIRKCIEDRVADILINNAEVLIKEIVISAENGEIKVDFKS